VWALAVGGDCSRNVAHGGLLALRHPDVAGPPLHPLVQTELQARAADLELRRTVTYSRSAEACGNSISQIASRFYR